MVRYLAEVDVVARLKCSPLLNINVLLECVLFTGAGETLDVDVEVRPHEGRPNSIADDMADQHLFIVVAVALGRHVGVEEAQQEGNDRGSDHPVAVASASLYIQVDQHLCRQCHRHQGEAEGIEEPQALLAGNWGVNLAKTHTRLQSLVGM